MKSARLVGGILLALIVVTGGAAAYKTLAGRNNVIQEVLDLPPAQTYQDDVIVGEFTTSSRPSAGSTSTIATASSTAPTTPTAKPLPAEFRLAVPFMSQAPKSDWGMPYQEACEEASLIMVHEYYNKKTGVLDVEEADKAILDLVAWQAKKRDPKIVDLTAEEAGEDAEEYWGNLKAEVVPIKTAEDLKKILVSGAPIVIPANGKTLANPNFRNGGPIYHMLVLTGYTKDGKFITNDPGTRLGRNFLYTEENLVNSIADWNGGDVVNGKKVVLVLRKS